MRTKLLTLALLLSGCTAFAQSPTIGLSGQSGSSAVSWPTQSGSAVSGYPSGIQTIVATTFTEGASGASLDNTSPAVNVHGNKWAVWVSDGSFVYNPAGAVAPNTASGNVLNTGASSYTITFSGVVNTNLMIVTFSMKDGFGQDRMELWMTGAGGIVFKETVSGVTTTIQTQAVANGATGSVVAVVHGTSITVTAFGQAPMTYTIPAGHGDIGGQYFAFLTNVFGITLRGVTVTVP